VFGDSAEHDPRGVSAHQIFVISNSWQLNDAINVLPVRADGLGSDRCGSVWFSSFNLAHASAKSLNERDRGLSPRTRVASASPGRAESDSRREDAGDARHGGGIGVRTRRAEDVGEGGADG